MNDSEFDLFSSDFEAHPPENEQLLLTPISVVATESEEFYKLQEKIGMLKQQTKKGMSFIDIDKHLLSLFATFQGEDEFLSLSSISETSKMCSELVQLDPISEEIYTQVLEYVNSNIFTLLVSHVMSTDIVIHLLNLLEEQIQTFRIKFSNETNSLNTPLLDSKSMYQ